MKWYLSFLFTEGGSEYQQEARFKSVKCKPHKVQGSHMKFGCFYNDPNCLSWSKEVSYRLAQPPRSQGMDSSLGTPLGCVDMAKSTYRSNPRYRVVRISLAAWRGCEGSSSPSGIKHLTDPHLCWRNVGGLHGINIQARSRLWSGT